MSDSESGRNVRRNLVLAFVLLALTAGAGAMVHRASSATLPLPATSAAGPLAFEAHAEDGIHFSGHLDRGAILDGGDGLVRMELGLRADRPREQTAPHVPSDLVVVLDRSGSMEGDKLVHARAAIRALLDRLGPEDRFSLVTYSSAAELRLPLEPATPMARLTWLTAVNGISASGGTNLAAGLDLALATVQATRSGGRAPRVILISDGLANQGDISRDGLRRRAERATQGEYALSTVGVGSDFDEDLMAALADAGSGNFHYVQSATNLSEIFAAELDTARGTVASGVELRFVPADGVELVAAAGYPIDREASGAFVVRPGTLFAGQDRRIWTTLRLPSAGAATQTLGTFSVSYRGANGALTQLSFPEAPRVARVRHDREFYAGLDRERWSSGIVVDAYNRLQQEVAGDVREGRAQEAQEKIEEYRKQVSAMNAHVASPTVSQKLAELKDLVSTVETAAAAPAPERARTAKELQAGALSAARPGAKKK